MDILTGLAAGIVGTFMMTLFMTLYSLIFKRPFFVIQILRDMFRGKAKDRYIIATAIHYGIGVLFSLIFLALILRNAFEFEVTNAIIFGAAVGTLGITGWIIFFTVRPLPFPIEKGHYLLVVWLGHLIFSLGMYLTYDILMGPTPVDTITICK